jgi:hypothetical protein
MEWPWAGQKCILCLREEEKLSRAHLFPEMLGGFFWSRTHCKDCNSFFGHEVEAAAKRDDSFRHAIERELAGELPDLADSFSEGQSYIARAEDGSLIRGARRHGEHLVGASTSEEGTRTQSREQAREGIETRLRRVGISEEDISGALERFDAAPEGLLTQILPGLGIKHGSVDGWDLPFDGGRVSEVFPAAIAFHFLALRTGRTVYSPIFNPLREEIRAASTEPTALIVESGLSRLGYRGTLIVGTEQTMPHTVIRVQIFGEFIWRVHLPHLCCSTDRLPCDGIALEIKSKAIAHLRPKPDRAPIALPQ